MAKDKVKEINQAGVRIARQAAGKDTFVLGTVVLPGLKQCELSLDEIIQETLQVNYLLETNQIDGLLFETYYDEEIIAVLKAVRPLTDLPIIITLLFMKRELQKW